MTKDGLAHAALKAGQPLVAALYSRVSKDDRNDQRSVSDQDGENRDVCEDEGWEVGEAYCDNDKSASRFATKQREDWDRLLEDVAIGRFHVVVLWESSRGDRRLAHWIAFLDTCRDLGVLIHITSHERTYDPGKRRDYKTLAEEGMDSADDSEKTSERVRRDKRNAARKGLPAGRMLYGYQRIYEVAPNGKKKLAKVVFDEEVHTAVGQDGKEYEYTRAGLVREIVERIASGDSLRSVAVDLNRRGIPTSRNGRWGWTPTRIREISVNPAYVGQRVHQGVVLPGVQTVWEPLVPMEQFHACVARFNRTSRSSPREGAVSRLLTGLATCGVCGRVVRRMGSTRAPTYVCAPDSRSGFGPTTGYCVSRKISAVDGYVERSVCLRLSQPDLLEVLQQDRWADERLARLSRELAEKQALLEDARGRCAQGTLSLDSLASLEGLLLPQIEKARQQMSETRVAPVLRGLAGGALDDVVAEWERRSIPQRREVIRALCEKIEILPLGGGAKRYRPEESVRIVWRQPNRPAGDGDAGSVASASA
ncbi:recombinase family protein [Actinomadura decatromicini]|uniref:Recombinase family protein n=1 Tax=Actinomadura decatromicini TaxID=2604572 RepID=A0A5D3FA87_9ACTN|nr:recombinase family protein [Actinomadura decatromicini]TYK45231.1 recombinase family protein [Actinomadura decatromicini]